MNTALNRARQQYLEQQVSSASPERLLTMLYDRLLVDIDRAALAQSEGNWVAAGNHLTHAQQIVTELNVSLTDAWDGSADLRGVYIYLTGRLIVANVNRDAEVTAECRGLVAPLRDAWHQAAAVLQSEAAKTSAAPAVA